MSAQQPSHYPLEYIPLPLSTQSRSFDDAPTQEVRAAQYTAVGGYPHYLTHQYSSNFSQPPYPRHPRPPPSAPLATGHHHHHPSRTPSAPSALPVENWYPSPNLDSPYPPATSAPQSTHYTSTLPPHANSFHPNLVYQGHLPTHQNPLMDLDNYLFSSPARQLPPTSIPVSPTHSNPASISPSVSPAEYPSGVLAEYPFSMPPAHDDSPRQSLLTSLHSSSSTPTAPHPNPPTHHRMHHSLTCFLPRPADDSMTCSTPIAHQYNPQPQLTSEYGVPTNGTNRPRHVPHGSATSLYNPYSASRAPSSSSPSLDTPRPHVCGICHAAFHRNHDLKRHKDVHNDTKPYVCQCGRAFTRKDALKRHIFLKSCGKDKGHESA